MKGIAVLLVCFMMMGCVVIIGNRNNTQTDNRAGSNFGAGIEAGGDLEYKPIPYGDAMSPAPSSQLFDRLTHFYIKSYGADGKPDNEAEME